MNTSPCLIVDITDLDQWPNFYNAAAPVPLAGCPQRIPQDRQPTVLQPSEKVAIEEARRLALRFPGHRFAIFEARLMGLAADVPSHVTVSGQVFQTCKVARIVEIGDWVPF